MQTRAKMKDVGAMPKTFEGMVAKDIAEATQELLGKIKSDTGKGANASRVLAELFMWNWIRKHADSQYDKLMDQAREEGVLGDTGGLQTGNHIMAESRHFVVMANVTEPVKRFSADALCAWALEKFKIPVILMKEQIEKSKLPTKPQVRVTITERE